MIRSAKCPSVEVRTTCLVTRDHDLMKKRDRNVMREQRNEEAGMKHRKVNGKNVFEVT